MAIVIASLILLSLLMVVAAPGIQALVRPRAVPFATSFYVLLIAALGVYHLGFSGVANPVVPYPTSAVSRQGAGGATGRPPDGLCQQALDQARQGGLILHEERGRVTVNREVWSQLPESARRAMVACLEGAVPGADNQTSVEILEANRQ